MITPLTQLWHDVERTSRKLEPTNKWRPVLGGGCSEEPLLAFIFINPTVRNLSVRPDWGGMALPFVGVPAFWQVMRAAGLEGLDTAASTIAASWSPELARDVYQAIEDQRVYLTNLVKQTAPNGDAPSAFLVNTYYPFLVDELKIIRPRAIVTFGLLPYKTLTGQTVRLRDCLDTATVGGQLVSSSCMFATQTSVYPCYFPTGRGNPSKAAKLLSIYLGAQLPH